MESKKPKPYPDVIIGTPKRKYPPTRARLNELEAIEREHYRLRNQEMLKPFVEEFKEALGVLAAHTSFEDWPHFFKMAFKYVSNRGYTTAARHYKSLLPNKELSNGKSVTERAAESLPNTPRTRS